MSSEVEKAIESGDRDTIVKAIRKELSIIGASENIDQYLSIVTDDELLHTMYKFIKAMEDAKLKPEDEDS